ncbi:delta-9 desaturase-like 1 protein [Brassica rapa]|uniref:delta-9 desaturase-like 1 protein n=1 Tax=Brassica campestris TaxID=3711 RepID=UPI00142DA312|nr:delta-9 desaturase-like 1 protein [Brassica rapa]
MDDTTKEDGSGSSRKPVRKEKRSYIFRKWTWIDVMKASSVGTVHLLCVLAPFNFKWEALLFGVILAIMSALSITFSYHRNLAHRSFKLPKWLEYSFAYSALFALQGHPIDWVSTHRFHHQFTDSDRDPHSPIEGFWFSHVFWIFDSSYIREKCGGRDNVMDLKQQWFYRFLRNTIGLHIMTFWTLVYLWGGLPYLTCGVVRKFYCINVKTYINELENSHLSSETNLQQGVGGTITYHGTGIVNSACHILGSRAWNTKDTSRNIWWLGPFTMGESWHNNHHAFETSARYGLEWYQVDLTWYLISFFQALGLATDVKLPSETQKRKLAFAR